MRPRILALSVVAVLCATAAVAQVNYQPTSPPDTSATDRAWYRSGDPIPFAGDLYYQTGPTIYFNGDTMVPTGTYDGVTLYADTTLEPYSLVYVPIGGNLLRPYERLRAGNLAGTTGSRMPTFPVQISRYPRSVPRASAEAEQQPQGRRQRAARRPEPRTPPAESAAGPEERPQGGLLVETVRRPNDNAGMWVLFQGFRWQHAGDATMLDSTRLSRVGDYHGLPVYADARTPYIIYIPLRDDLVAPFRRTGP